MRYAGGMLITGLPASDSFFLIESYIVRLPRSSALSPRTHLNAVVRRAVGGHSFFLIASYFIRLPGSFAIIPPPGTHHQGSGFVFMCLFISILPEITILVKDMTTIILIPSCYSAVTCDIMLKLQLCNVMYQDEI